MYAPGDLNQLGYGAALLAEKFAQLSKGVTEGQRSSAHGVWRYST